MTSVFDIAAEIQSRTGSTDWYVINKLAYYVQAWSLVWRDQAAFADRIEAWRQGPVIPRLYKDQRHDNNALIRRAQPLAADLQRHVDRVLDAYGHLSAEKLVELAHRETPWVEARRGLPAGASCDQEITLDSMRRYYARLWNEAEDDERRAAAPATFTGSIDELEALLSAG
ncbi:MAG TPA: type II toxin-antitoxin system antitoxin SocA domain-containing protein [Kofleriaceae bacterium]